MRVNNNQQAKEQLEKKYIEEEFVLPIWAV